MKKTIETFDKLGKLCRNIGKHENLLISLMQQSTIQFNDLNNPQKALELAEEAHSIAQKQGYAEHMERIAGILDEIRGSL